MDEKPFEYSYSAKEQEEITRIREKYASREPSRLEQLRRLDASATKPGRIVSVTLGTLSTLVLGLGMCCTTVWAEQYFLTGIVIGLVGLAGVCAAYPLYRSITRRRRKKLAPEILRLTDELS